jgi:preprotein translocase subunit SecE
MLVSLFFDGGAPMTFLAKIGTSFKRGFGSTFSFIGDSWKELKKVKWPGRKELVSYTLVVVFLVIFVTVYFWLLDWGISELVRLIF